MDSFNQKLRRLEGKKISCLKKDDKSISKANKRMGNLEAERVRSSEDKLLSLNEVYPKKWTSD